MVKKIISFRSKNNEREKLKSEEIYELPMPVVDAVQNVVSKKA